MKKKKESKLVRSLRAENQLLITQCNEHRTTKEKLFKRILDLETALRDIFAATDNIRSHQQAAKRSQLAIESGQQVRITACGRGRALLSQTV